MTDERLALIEQARVEHQKLGGDTGNWCRFCSRLWPCLPIRLADVLEEQAERIVGLQIEVGVEGGRADCFHRGLAQSEEIRMNAESKLSVRLARAERELETARDALATYGAHLGECQVYVAQRCTCGWDAIADREDK